MSGYVDIENLSERERELTLIWIRTYDRRVFDLALNYIESKRRPIEPHGLGAVVTNAKGHKFVRVADPLDGWAHGRQWQRIGGDINAVRNFGWLEIEAVKVLSEGLS